MRRSIVDNSSNLQPWDDALAILAAIIAEKHSANTRNTDSDINQTCTGGNGSIADDSSDRQQ
jgi:hypothetical protein